MGKRRKARQAEAMKRAKRKKIIFAAVCAAAVLITALIIFGSLRLSGTRTDEDGALDLTRLSLTMLSAEVNRITARPDNYIGQTIKMSGPYYAVYNNGLGHYQHFVAVKEVDSCCPFEGLEFIWNGDVSREAYPEPSTNVEVTGVFKAYEELGQTYYYLAVEDIIVLR